MVDRIEQPLHGPEPRRLDIEEPRRARLDVGDGMNRRVPAQPPLGPVQCLARVIGQRRILDDRLREELHDRGVEPRIGRLIDDRSMVLPFEVEHAHRAGRCDLAHVIV